MPENTLQQLIAALPKAELHLHLEGSMEPVTVAELAARHGLVLRSEEVAARYNYADFAGFLEAFKWVTSFLREPRHYAFITEQLVKQLLAQHVVYAEVTVSAGVMLLRKQDVAANFAAIHEAACPVESRGLKIHWILDAVRQFGPEPAMQVARWAARFRKQGAVAFGMGGDELAMPAAEFRGVYDFARSEGLHCLVHAGEIGGPQEVRDAIELLGAERIGHGIAASADAVLVELLADRGIPLEICLTSNLRTGALATLLAKPAAGIEQHPLRNFFERGVPVTISTDDPAMFRTSLIAEYTHLPRLGFRPEEIARVARRSFEVAFAAEETKRDYLRSFDEAACTLGLV